MCAFGTIDRRYQRANARSVLAMFHVKPSPNPSFSTHVPRETLGQLQMMHRNTAIIPQLPNIESLPRAAKLRCFIQPSST